MIPSEKYDINQLRDYSSLFSRNEVTKLLKNDLSTLHLKLGRYEPEFGQRKCTYLSYLKNVYKILKKFYPNEYVYKNEFINEYLIKEIGDSHSVIFNEFRLGKAVADLAIFNGVSKVFEIKTPLDKESRLSNQLDIYSQIFNQSYLIVPEDKLNQYLKRDSTIGIFIYSHLKNTFSLIREASYKESINVDLLMEILHTNEYIAMVEEYYGKRPSFHDFNKFSICKEMISEIPQDELNKLFIKLMKLRRIHNSFSKKAALFNQLFLAMNYNKSQKDILLSNLSISIA